jgi:hypothetical protein
MKITPSSVSDEVKEVMKGMECNEAAGTDLLKLEGFEYGGNENKNKMTEIVTKV